jgi:hypothetical protein
MESKASQSERVRTHPSTSNQPQTANQKEKIPGRAAFAGDGRMYKTNRIAGFLGQD